MSSRRKKLKESRWQRKKGRCLMQERFYRAIKHFGLSFPVKPMIAVSVWGE